MAKQNTIDGLNQLLADATIFYQKLRHYHWNVTGRHFFALHEKFEELYTRWAEAIDEIAERILTVEGVPVHTLASMVEKATLKEDETVPAAEAMVTAVEADLQTLHAAMGALIESAENGEDRGTANLVDGLRDDVEKDLWMLRSWKAESAPTWS